MSKYDPEEYKRNKESYAKRQRRYKEKNKITINERQRKYRKENGKENYKESRRRRLIAMKDKYKEYMSDKSCQHCGYSDNRALVWHHLDPKIKKSSVCRLIGRHNSWDTIATEINKCICLCHNCHNILHNHQSP